MLETSKWDGNLSFKRKDSDEKSNRKEWYLGNITSTNTQSKLHSFKSVNCPRELLCLNVRLLDSWLRNRTCLILNFFIQTYLNYLKIYKWRKTEVWARATSTIISMDYKLPKVWLCTNMNFFLILIKSVSLFASNCVGFIVDS